MFLYRLVSFDQGSHQLFQLGDIGVAQEFSQPIVFGAGFCGDRFARSSRNSASSLKLWLNAIYLMSSTRCGISAKLIEREIRRTAVKQILTYATPAN
ncbi:MAG TPA: hypothetical protein VIW95_01345 [Candidatus Binatus sp.]|uniref:hypothetical protein n=1 Tax=Candidatus Binatus sp. TaxID=2811406 RepID=UPI002F42E67A